MCFCKSWFPPVDLLDCLYNWFKVSHCHISIIMSTFSSCYLDCWLNLSVCLFALWKCDLSSLSPPLYLSLPPHAPLSPMSLFRIFHLTDLISYLCLQYIPLRFAVLSVQHFFSVPLSLSFLSAIYLSLTSCCFSPSPSLSCPPLPPCFTLSSEVCDLWNQLDLVSRGLLPPSCGRCNLAAPKGPFLIAWPAPSRLSLWVGLGCGVGELGDHQASLNPCPWLNMWLTSLKRAESLRLSLFCVLSNWIL